jgi:REP element-mobilizing transposase RayT
MSICTGKRIAIFEAIVCLRLAQSASNLCLLNIRFASCNRRRAPRGLRILASLRPEDSVAATSGKLKGQVAKWLRQSSGEQFARGYFACASGDSTTNRVAEYLSSQGEHHGYASRIRPPVHVAAFQQSPSDEQRLQPVNAHALLRFHMVLGTWQRRGVFGSPAGSRITNAWRSLEVDCRFVLLKVSFVPDHVHLAVRIHPSVAPSHLVVTLMNVAQRVAWSEFASDVIQARVERLWQPSAYIGSFGDLATSQLKAYLRNCAE